MGRLLSIVGLGWRWMWPIWWHSSLERQRNHGNLIEDSQ